MRRRPLSSMMRDRRDRDRGDYDHDDETFEGQPFYEGEDEARKKVYDWIKNEAKSFENEGGLVIELYHFQAGAMEGEEPFDEVDFDLALNQQELARDIVERCCRYADDIESGRSVRFVIKIPNIRRKVIFTLNAPERETGDDVDEAPNVKGLMMQQMRHNEKLVRVNVTAMDRIAAQQQQINSAHQKTIEMQADRIKNLEDGYMGHVRQAEEIYSLKHLRDMDVEKMRNDERRKEDITGMLMTGLPMVVNKVLSSGPDGGRQQMFNESRSPIEMQLEGLAQSLTNEQFQALMQSGILNQFQAMSLIEIVQIMRARQEAEARTRAAQGQSQNQPPPPASPFGTPGYAPQGPSQGPQGGQPPPNGSSNKS